MSFATAQSSRIISTSYHFVLYWTLKAKQLNDIWIERDCLWSGWNDSVICSDSYEFEAIKDFSFCLELGRSETKIKGSKKWLFDLKYAFLQSKERVFGLKSSEELLFLPSFQDSCVSDEEDVTIHFAVYAKLLTKCPPELLRTPISDLKGSECDITNYIQKGIIPEFTVHKTLKIMSNPILDQCQVLRLLCLEYLMDNINAESLRDILKVAMDLGHKHLERECVKKIADGRFKLKEVLRKSRSYNNSADSDRSEFKVFSKSRSFNNSADSDSTDFESDNGYIEYEDYNQAAQSIRL